MKAFKSIKWRLQLWYGLILVAVLAGFGVTAYQLERGRQVGRIDNELHRRFDVLVRALHRPPHRPDGIHRFDGPPPGHVSDDGPPGPDMPPDQGFPPPENFSLPPQAEVLFGTNDPENYYFVIVNQNGAEIARTGDVPTHWVMAAVNNGLVKTNDDRGPELAGPRPPPIWTDNGFRGIYDRTPAGDRIYVGCSLNPTLAELHHTAINLTAFGGLILLVGLAGGGWFVGRALRPISEISSTAAKISAGDLSQRINTAEADGELGQLAAVLNSTFARLETAFAQQKQFAADAAHELRTPVSVILTQTQTALQRERDAAGYKQTVEACRRAAQRMRKLIESLLELARFDAGQEVLKRLRFDFSRTILDAVELVKPLAEERGVKIVSELDSLEISGDPERLAQVVLNLLTNAIQYNHPNGEVRLHLESENGLVLLKIADTGPGIPPGDLPHLFERFYRAEKSRTGAGNAGLGLAICKAIIEAHAGTIEVFSRENAGTTFSVRLPAQTNLP
jgi:heavy metal sensor kinase